MGENDAVSDAQGSQSCGAPAVTEPRLDSLCPTQCASLLQRNRAAGFQTAVPMDPQTKFQDDGCEGGLPSPVETSELRSILPSCHKILFLVWRQRALTNVAPDGDSGSTATGRENPGEAPLRRRARLYFRCGGLAFVANHRRGGRGHLNRHVSVGRPVQTPEAVVAPALERRR